VKKEIFDKRCAEMRQSNNPPLPDPVAPPSSVTHSGHRHTLKEAASELGVSYSTARRIFSAENVSRYSAAGDAPVYPATPLKRFQAVRMTYVITDADIERVKDKMRGGRC
jgi:AraC-like DNA-binding protein